MKKPAKRLHLELETIARLVPVQLEHVVGGALGPSNNPARSCNTCTTTWLPWDPTVTP